MQHYLVLVFTLLFFLSCEKKDNNQTESIYEAEERLDILTQLPKKIDESSGLLISDGTLWTHNDSGDKARIYAISQSTNELEKEINIANAKHRDWEDIAQDTTHLYIGDFGNNSGNRKDLTIYKIPKLGLVDSIAAEKIEFSFSDQSNFDNSNYDHNFDCEAMIVYNNSIYLFSKNHQNKGTRLYRLPTTPGVYEAEKIDSFHTDGVITGASIDKDNKVLCLLGYQYNASYYNTFAWIFHTFEGSDFFNGISKRVDLPIQAQTEGICFQQDLNVLISNESEEGEDANLYLFDVGKWLD